MERDINGTTIGRIGRHKLPDSRKRVSEEAPAANLPYFGSLEREILKGVEKDMAQSNAGSLANQGIWLMDLWHEAEGSEDDFRKLLFEQNQDEMVEAYQRAKDALDGIQIFLEESSNRDLAQDIIDYKMINEVEMGGTIEREAAEMLEEHYEPDEILRKSTAIAAETGFRQPESAGIDLAIIKDGDVTTFQVKKDDGGDLEEDHPADFLVRVFTETGRVRVYPQ